VNHASAHGENESLPLSALEWIDAACMEFEAVWQQGTAPHLEEYLARAAAPEQPALFRELLRIDLHYRHPDERARALADYHQQFPEYAAWIEACNTPFPRSPGTVGHTGSGSIEHSEGIPTTGGEAGAATPESSSPYPEIPGYEILGTLGHGGMGVVYRARQLRPNRPVALKMIRHPAHAGELERRRFLREAQAIAQLQHPNIVEVYEVGEHQGGPFFSLEFIEGGSLDRLIGGTPQALRASAQMVRTLALAMQAAHEQKIIHRDLKPANVLLAGCFGPAGDATSQPVPLHERVPKISDFGLAKYLDDEFGQTRSRDVMGTPSYMPPEQADGRLDQIGPWTDVWALGAILYELLTGRPPFKGQTVWETLEQVRSQDPVPPRQLQPKVDRDLETICLKCLRKPPEGRYSSAQELADDLQRYLEGRPILARPTSRRERLFKWARRKPFQAVSLVAGIVCLAALVVALFAGMLYANSRRDLLETKAELQRQELDRKEQELARGRERQAEQRQREKAQKTFTEEYVKAETRAQDARPGDVETWREVNDTLEAALKPVPVYPTAFRDFALVHSARQLLNRAKGHLAAARERQENLARLPQLIRHLSDAVFWGTLATGLELQDNLELAQRAVADGLKLFQVARDNDGPPVVDPRFFTEAQKGLITDLCYQLLLIDAELLARPVGAVKEDNRLRQSLRLLDCAARLRPGRPTYSALDRRANYLEQLGRKDEADQARQEAAGVAPELAADFFLIGMDRYQGNDLPGAIQALDTTLSKQPEHQAAEYLLAVSRLRQGGRANIAAARDGLKHCMEKRKDFPWFHLQYGYAEMELGNFKEARDSFDRVLKNPPDKSAAYIARVNRGVLSMKQGAWEAAISDLEQAVKEKPEAVTAYINLALIHRQRAGQLPWQRYTLLLAPQGLFSLMPLAAEHRQQAYREGIAVLDEALRRQPRVARLYHERGRIRLLLEDAGAREDFARAILLARNVSPLSTIADDLIDLGRILHRSREHTAAVRAFAAVLDPRLSNKIPADRRALALRLMAEPLLSLRRYREAGAALDLYLKMTPAVSGESLPPEQTLQLVNALKARGLIHAEQKEFRAASESYTRGLGLKRDPELLNLRGWAYLALNSPGLARADFDEALAQRPAYEDALMGRADARVKLGKVVEALTDVEKGLRAVPESARREARVRMLYSAARVHAQAAARFRRPGTDQPLDLRAAARSEARALELLRTMLRLVPPAGRAAFWRDHVQIDAALSSIRNRPDWVRLAAEISRSGS
jgi:eukaryotic-like serine/threonine-protein kinase